MANLITCIRIICSIVLLFCPVFSPAFYILYLAANKVTGVMLFVLPLTLTFIDLKISGTIVSMVATFAAIQEGHLIRTGNNNSTVH